VICHDARFKTYRVSSHTAARGRKPYALVADLAQRYQVLPNQIYAWKKQLLEHAARAFEGGGGDAGAGHAREVEKLHAKVG
jgi:transposase